MMATAFCQAVIEQFPKAQVDLIVKKGFENLPLPHRGEILPFNRARQKSGRFGVELRERGYDRMYVLPPSFSSAWMAWRSQIPERIGYAGELRSALLRPALQSDWQPRSRHLVEEYLDLLGEQTPPSPIFPRLLLTEEWCAQHLQALPELPEPFAALAPGAIYGPAKQWPAEAFHETVRLLREANPQLELLILGTPTDQALGESIAANLEGAHNWCGRSNLPQLVAILSRAQWLLSNDSGSMHIMAALQRPQVAIFGSTSTTWTRPLNPLARWITREEPCSPCFARTCRFGHYRCLKEISPTEVTQLLQELPSPTP